MSIEQLQPTYDFKEEQIKKLHQIFPEAVKDGKVDFEALKEALGEINEEDDSELYGLQWPGKKKAKKLAFTKVEKTLEPQIGEGVDEENTKNIFIEGDNLEVLKVLEKSYKEKIKMIYIDPPYNTGGDLFYKDDFKIDKNIYLEHTSQVDISGKLVTNVKTNGRFHSEWLNMMYPRLKLAHQLLKEDGVMFISIDDNEVDNLSLLCKEIFGDSNVEIYIWDVREDGTMPKTAKNTVRKEHEYIIAAYKEQKQLKKFSSFKYINNDDWSNIDNDPRGPWMSANISRGSGEASGGSKSYVITNPAGKEFYRDWSIEESEFYELLKDNRIYFADGGNGVPRKKIFKNEPVISIQSSIFEKLLSSQTAKKEIIDLLGVCEFDYPKPTELLSRLIQIGTDSDDIVLDFFGGTGSTAHAVMKQNEILGNRKFILVQFPEEIDEKTSTFKKGYKTISEFALERIRKASKKYTNSGFKSYKLSDSNFKSWEPIQTKSTNELFNMIEEQIIPLQNGWTKPGLLTEIILQEGFPLDSKVQTSQQFTGNEVSLVTSDSKSQRLFVCLDDKINSKTIDSLVLEDTDIFVCLDSAISTEDKTKLSDLGVIKTI